MDRFATLQQQHTEQDVQLRQQATSIEELQQTCEKLQQQESSQRLQRHLDRLTEKEKQFDEQLQTTTHHYNTKIINNYNAKLAQQARIGCTTNW